MTGELAYLYCGSRNVEEDLAFYCEGLGAQIMWRFNDGGVSVSALSLGTGPPVLLATHRPVPSILPIWTVDDLDSAVAALKASGWTGEEHRVEVPDGPCSVLRDPSGNEVALLHRIRPKAAESMARSWREDHQG